MRLMPRRYVAVLHLHILPSDFCRNAAVLHGKAVTAIVYRARDDWRMCLNTVGSKKTEIPSDKVAKHRDLEKAQLKRAH